ncbi:chromate efflux transporter [Acinetobacter sp. V102_4]|uniref:chromate efflux transporter n=1 Tax=Acinetobacter sp. V102_4 TaxID=3072984 RepID=UPI00287E9283|nr:chromate efflux transporter [Acinetobacter sp. V102_4]MDS7928282.1 chromate efflux transporter [Acinetobacter sp. V102_4]
MNKSTKQHNTIDKASVWEVFFVFLRLGLISFGGPIAHLGYFRTEFVERRQWLSDHAYADLVGLCQFLPGPASSQVGIVLGLSRAGYWGAFAAWLGFTLPSAVALILFALGLSHLGSTLDGGLHGLKVVAVAIVAQALWQMGKNLCPDRLRASMAIIAAVMLSLIPSTSGQIIVIVGGGIFGMTLLKKVPSLPETMLTTKVSWQVGVLSLIFFFSLLLILPLLASITHNHLIMLIDSFYRAGALVFGGGHVVLPLLQASVVGEGWVTNDTFLAGYGAAQAVPGPLFTFAAYLGAAAQPTPNSWLGGFITLIVIFLPAFLLVFGVIPFWQKIRHYPAAQRAMMGVNAVVVGILLAAFYHPVWTSAILRPIDFALAVTAYLLLTFWKLPPWFVVLLSASAGIVTA